MKAALLGLSLLLLAACAGPGAIRLDDGKIVRAGMTRTQIIDLLGPPTKEWDRPVWQKAGEHVMKYKDLKYRGHLDKTAYFYLDNGVVTKLRY